MDLHLLQNGSSVCDEDPGEPTTGVKRVSVTEQESVLLAELARDLRVLEIGTGLGVSTRALASTAADVHTVDIDPWVEKHVWPTLPDNVTYHREWTGAWPYEMIFVDADHRFEAVLADLQLADHLSKRTLIVAHDWKIPEVRQALDSTWTLIDTYHGLAIKSVGY